MIDIVEVTNKKLMRKFVRFPLELYKDCPYYVPALYMDELNILDEKKNPAAEGCRTKCFLAMREKKTVGRVAGIINDNYNAKSGKKFIRFSRIDFIDDEEVSAALIDAVEKYGRENGMETIHGPWDFNDTGREGMQMSEYDRMCTFITAYNYAYYPRHIERLGFVKEVGWKEYYIHSPKELNPRVDKIADYCLKKYELAEVPIKSVPKTIKKYGQQLMDLYNQAYAELYGTFELGPRAQKQVLDTFGAICRPEYVSLIVDKNDKIVGLGVAIPSVAKAVKRSGGKLLPFGIFRLLRAMKTAKTIELALIGVTDEYRNKGLNGVIMRKIVKNALERGVVGADTNPELETNANVQGQWDMFDKVDLTRIRQTYTKSIN